MLAYLKFTREISETKKHIIIIVIKFKKYIKINSHERYLKQKKYIIIIVIKLKKYIKIKNLCGWLRLEINTREGLKFCTLFQIPRLKKYLEKRT